MVTDLIIDGNYILSKSVFVLHKNNLLYGALHKALENTVSNYRKWFPFRNIYLVSDSKEKSWRKNLNPNYKSNRKKDSDIDWEFAYTAYGEFKSGISGVKVMEVSSIEGDDWISFLINKSNIDGVNTITVSNDGDIKQLVSYSTDPLYINIMTNEMYNREKVFVPQNYQMFLEKINRLPNDDIFSLNNNSEFIRLLNNFTTKYEVISINPVESLFVKIISGDTSDNISSVWSVTKDGKTRGIGQKGAETLYQEYLTEFGEVNLSDPDIFDNISDLICEKKKLPKSVMSEIIQNIEKNMKLVDLRIDKLPKPIVEKMNEAYDAK